jgi:hypothetical protein
MSEQALKGPAAEEALRNYFLSIGYFVVRGCKFRYSRFDVTDVDLWLYGKSSALHRERINVDIKNKKTPQALERIFWAKGLQSVLGLDGCIVATTDSRPDVRAFGLEHGVTVLDGAFLGRLVKSGRSHQERLTEEALLGELDRESLGKLGGDWRGRYESGKSRILDALSFDGCNAWLDDINYYVEQSIQAAGQPTAGWRLVYLSLANFLISVDFILREHIASDHDQRRQLLESGFRYGSAGQAYTEKVGRLAAALVVSVVSQSGIGDEVQRALAEQAESVRADVLAEHLSKGVTPSLLFDQARELEALAFQASPPSPAMLSVNAKGLLGVMADFFGLDRKKVLA